ncbi:MAG: serine hydrolase domain-containing protein [Candidatus Sumerlaeia bacterium]|nr:serine hydrolase domain-containing protein [Candidatus Sumerlaeia bacterium]
MRSIAAAIAVWALAAAAPADTTAIDWAPVGEKASAIRESTAAPGLGFALLHGGEPVLLEGYGLADRDPERPVTPDTVFAVGSISKVVTATLLVALRDEGRLRLDDPLGQYLPEGVAAPTGPLGETATLRDLAMHTSGFARMPSNMKRPSPEGDPYNGYEERRLFAAIPRTPPDAPAGRRYGYSNFAFGVLGRVIEKAAGEPYAELVRKRIAEPLGLDSMRVAPRREDAGPELARGYQGDAPEKPAPWWNLGAMDSAGSVVASTRDLAAFLAWQMRAGESETPAVASRSLREAQTPARPTGKEWDTAVGLGWHITRKPYGEVVWHNGSVGGFASFMGFERRRGLGVVLLANSDRGVTAEGFDLLGEAAGLLDAVAPIPSTELVAARRVASLITADPPKDLGGAFHPGFLDEVPALGLRLAFAGHFATHGSPGEIELTKGDEPGSTRATVTMEREGPLVFDFMVAGEDDPRVVYLLFGE